MGWLAGASKGAVQPYYFGWYQSLVQRKRHWAWRANYARNQQESGKLANRTCTGDPCATDQPFQRGVSDKELSSLLAGTLLVPIVYNTTYAALRNVSPMFSSRGGLDTGEDSVAVVVQKIAELISV
ncbi:hypothetical protein [Methylotenera sp.]|uniref:hypothetical protein n=1 Tax=Methylotenera sp. TaxID=2051956 RepID=UPI0027375E8F|nr:hypothetical protein [Methylotenera sp.]MDP3777623.1 hypothetical protein [Methylotenera sp.]